MNNYKFQKIKYDDGEIRAYKLGRNTLIKHYYWGNYYDWLISRTGATYAGSSFEIDRGLKDGTLEIAHSCKHGKQRLIELFESEKRG